MSESSQMRLLVAASCLLFLSSAVSSDDTCVDLADFCESLQPMCIGSIIKYQLEQLENVANQITNSTAMPALETSLPLIRQGSDGLPLVGSTQEEEKEIEEQLKNSLPFLKESLPLIRESLPLIRESLPLIRLILDPLYYDGEKTSCQRKASCKSCRECPQLRSAATAFVESLCPATCKVCDKAVSPREAASALVNFYV